MGESSRRSRKRSSKRRERRSKPDATRSCDPLVEKSKGEWEDSSRRNAKSSKRVNKDDVSKRRYLAFDDDDSTSDRKKSDRRSRKKKSKRSKRSDRSKKEKKEKKERKKRDESKESSRPVPSPTSTESPYISLSIGSDREVDSDRSKRVRRERKRMVVQTSPQRSKKSHGGFYTDDDGQKIDSVIFDSRSEMMRYKDSADILPTRRSTRSKKKPSGSDQRENEEYNRYYAGVKSRRSVESKLNRPGEFALYYEKPREREVPLSVNLMIAYLSSTSEPFHYPIQCFAGPDGHKHYVVMQTKSDGKMFTSILSLVKHYSLYSHMDTSTGRLETFSVPH